MQLMHVYSQKSIITTLPRRAVMVKGCELIHVVAGLLGMGASGGPSSAPGLDAGVFGLPPVGGNSGSATGNSGALTCRAISSWAGHGAGAVRQTAASNPGEAATSSTRLKNTPGREPPPPHVAPHSERTAPLSDRVLPRPAKPETSGSTAKRSLDPDLEILIERILDGQLAEVSETRQGRHAAHVGFAHSGAIACPVIGERARHALQGADGVEKLAQRVDVFLQAVGHVGLDAEPGAGRFQRAADGARASLRRHHIVQTVAGHDQVEVPALRHVSGIARLIGEPVGKDRKSTRLNSSHLVISY